jgi:hypothetical protein
MGSILKGCLDAGAIARWNWTRNKYQFVFGCAYPKIGNRPIFLAPLLQLVFIPSSIPSSNCTCIQTTALVLSPFQCAGWFGIEPNSIPRPPISTSK